ncbi:MAG: hypothetical protein AAFR38_03945 [Planctomycetota bacterium]
MGIRSIDHVLPGGGLALGAVHEFVQGRNAFGETRSGPWWAPLTLLTHLANTMASVPDEKEPETGRLVIWVGRRVWPCPIALEDRAELLGRSLLLDPADDADRLWAIDHAARSRAVRAVIADGTGLDMAGSRRLQLAAEAGGSLVLLARGPRERRAPSTAMTRWLIEPAAPEGMAALMSEERGGTPAAPRWRLELLRARGVGVPPGPWLIELGQAEPEQAEPERAEPERTNQGLGGPHRGVVPRAGVVGKRDANGALRVVAVLGNGSVGSSGGSPASPPGGAGHLPRGRIPGRAAGVG